MLLAYYVKHPFKRFIIKIIIILFTLFCILPILWMILTAFKTRIDFLSIPPKWFFNPTLQNFRDIFGYSKEIHFFTLSNVFNRAYINSLVISIFSVMLGLFFGTPLAYGLSRFNFKGKSSLAFWILSTRFAPVVVVLIPFFLIYSKIGLTDTYLGLIIIYLVINLPLIIWVMYGFFKEMPIDIEESAIVDGASPFTIFIKIVIPLVAPGLVAVSILSYIFVWNELMFALVITGSNTKTLPVAIYNFISYEEIAWGSLAASGMMATIPVIIFTLIIQKHLVSGLTGGAVKE